MNKEEKRDLVDNYLRKFPKEMLSPLRFADGDKNIKDLKINSEEIDDKELIRIILKESKTYVSIDINNSIETRPNKLRSSLDIWRHFKFYKPDTTIYHIMNLLWEIRKEFTYRYCSDVERRVFYFPFFSGYHIHSTYKDEYELKFVQWKDIDKFFST